MLQVHMRKPHFPILLLFILLSDCGKVDKGAPESASVQQKALPVFATSDEQKKYFADLLAFRSEKDSFLKVSPKSPIRKKERAAFQGLKYFDLDPKFVVRATLQKRENPPSVSITTTTGENRKAVKYGYLEFMLQGRTHRLAVFKFADEKTEASGDHLFVSFTDSTSGHETYGAGRYIDLEENETGEYLLDFNRAYNPYCAYNEAYSCPIPPRENRLAIAVRAGEKVYH